MKLIQALPPWARVLFYFLVLALGTVVAGTVPVLQDFWFFMLLAVILSWLFLRAEGRTLRATRLLPEKKKHWFELGGGSLAGGTLAFITFALTVSLTGDQWKWIGVLDWGTVAILFLTCLWSSIVQEFVFRGYPFQLLHRHYGGAIAQWVVAIPFALMHLHPGLNNTEIVLTILTTTLGSLFFGMAYLKTGHLALPIGLHFGWNFIQALLPRVGGDNSEALISVHGNEDHYTFWTVLAPYIAIILLGTWLCTRLKTPNASEFHQV